MIVKAGETCYHVERVRGQDFQLCLFEQAAEAFRRTHWETVGLVEGGRFTVDCNGGVPELTQKPCSVGVVPNVNRYGAARLGDPAEFLQRPDWAWKEIQAETADDS